jgi:hypothetical protein
MFFNYTSEITITGKPDASSAERAVLSATGSNARVLTILTPIKVRLEHIEISGGENGDAENLGLGIELVNAVRLTLGPGAVVRGNQGEGIFIGDGASCILDGGEIRENDIDGVAVGKGGVFTMRSGSIKNNKNNGIGVIGDGALDFTPLGRHG